MNGHKIVNQDGLHFITCTVVGWIDVFTRREYKDIIIDSLKYCQKNKGLSIHAYVIMSNHVHLILSSKETSLSDTIRDFKTYTSKMITNQIIQKSEESSREWMLKLFKYFAKFNQNNSKYQFWQRDNYAIELTSPKWITTRIRYIHNNPINAGIVTKAEDYLYSSASNYINGGGIISIDTIDFGLDIGFVHI